MTTEAGVSAEDVLRKAAELIRRDGWAVGRLYREDGARCILGAIDAASRHGPIQMFTDASVLARSRIPGAPFLDDWNDAPGRTVEEVLAVLEGVD